MPDIKNTPGIRPWVAIAAVSENGVIGNGADIPWHLPEDFKWFKQATLGHVLVMGRKTFESIGRPLPKRQTVVVTRSTGFSCEGVDVIASPTEIADIETRYPDKTIFIAGGGEIYRQTLPQCSGILLSLVHRTVEGDVRFPAFEEGFTKVETLRAADDFSIFRYRNNGLQ